MKGKLPDLETDPDTKALFKKFAKEHPDLAKKNWKQLEAALPDDVVAEIKGELKNKGFKVAQKRSPAEADYDRLVKEFPEIAGMTEQDFIDQLPDPKTLTKKDMAEISDHWDTFEEGYPALAKALEDRYGKHIEKALKKAGKLAQKGSKAEADYDRLCEEYPDLKDMSEEDFMEHLPDPDTLTEDELAELQSHWEDFEKGYPDLAAAMEEEFGPHVEKAMKAREAKKGSKAQKQSPAEDDYDRLVKEHPELKGMTEQDFIDQLPDPKTLNKKDMAMLSDHWDMFEEGYPALAKALEDKYGKHVEKALKKAGKLAQKRSPAEADYDRLVKEHPELKGMSEQDLIDQLPDPKSLTDKDIAEISDHWDMFEEGYPALAKALEDKYGKHVEAALKARGKKLAQKGGKLEEEWNALCEEHPELKEMTEEDFEAHLPDPDTLSDEDLAELEGHWEEFEKAYPTLAAELEKRYGHHVENALKEREGDSE